MSTITSKAYLLDSSTVVAIFRGDQKASVFVESRLTYISIIAVGELLFGAENSGRKAENIRNVEAFISKRRIIPCDVQTAYFYARIAAALKQIVHPIPQNDMWIAATALQYDLPVITSDSHFNYVQGLTIETW